MGVIRKLKDKELVGGTQDEEVYPVTSTQSVYNSQNKTLDQLLALNLPINISANYSANYSATAYSLQEAISAVPLYDRRIGFVGTFLSKDLTPNKWVTIQYNGVSVDSSAWVNPDNWVQMLSELDIVQSSGNSEDKVMSQKAVKEFVEGYSDSKVVYDISLFDALSFGDNVSDAFVPISGGFEGMSKFPSIGDKVANVAYGSIQGVVIFSGIELRTGRKVVIYTSYGGVNTIYINNNSVSNISRTHVYNFALLKTINGDSMSSELRAAFIPVGGNELIPPRAGDVAVSAGSSESAVFVSVTYDDSAYTIHYIVNDEHRMIKASSDWVIQDYTVYSLPELKYSIEAMTATLPLSRFLVLQTGDSQANVAKALGISSSATSRMITTSLIRLSTVPVINLVSNNADTSENRIKCNISEFSEIIGASDKTLYRISFIYMGKAYDYDFYAKDNNEYTVRVTVGGLNVETLSFVNIQALNGASNVTAIKNALKISDSSMPIIARLENLSKSIVILTDDDASDNFEDRTYVNLYKTRRSINSTSYAGVAMTYMSSNYIQTTFFYNPTPKEGDLDYSKTHREVYLLGEPSID
ncbi:hypothetical protein KNV43_gp018 [uncultured phage cr128_1]|uniref:Uncharacterized protein n=1 Tax=uncultured phage cr128_1 TaxID=2772076 RepID=A0A7M1S020_9CAUD|nr:hypothetical protein KNV43_gp018 [uncultured phage cr128_1]QOR59734.1 hypothetical protein [uncultured phage cr128_1]DAQ75984.1 MAG TPA: hypothetical protein [Bacteriophage sp.]